jgi:hypothetical protein
MTEFGFVWLVCQTAAHDPRFPVVGLGTWDREDGCKLMGILHSNEIHIVNLIRTQIRACDFLSSRVLEKVKGSGGCRLSLSQELKTKAIGRNNIWSPESRIAVGLSATRQENSLPNGELFDWGIVSEKAGIDLTETVTIGSWAGAAITWDPLDKASI